MVTSNDDCNQLADDIANIALTSFHGWSRVLQQKFVTKCKEIQVPADQLDRNALRSKFPSIFQVDSQLYTILADSVKHDPKYKSPVASSQLASKACCVCFEYEEESNKQVYKLHIHEDYICAECARKIYSDQRYFKCRLCRQEVAPYLADIPLVADTRVAVNRINLARRTEPCFFIALILYGIHRVAAFDATFWTPMRDPEKSLILWAKFRGDQEGPETKITHYAEENCMGIISSLAVCFGTILW